MCGEWFNQARFGMFIHWGVYSIPAKEYEKLASNFNPKKYNPEEWVTLAQEAGMKYMVLTTRHHDGYSLFDSQVSDFTAPKTAAKRDLIAEYVEACRKKGMRTAFYYSLLDWRYQAYFDGPQKDPDGWAQFRDYVHTQVRELCTNYGKIDVMWYDGAWPWKPEDWRSAELNAMVRKFQPEILINNRSGLPEDFGTPEQKIEPSKEAERMWETCMTMNDNWGYSAADQNWKSVKQLIMNLVRCARDGGNYLLNVGPKPDGTIPLPSVTRLKEIGKWMKVNGESIYGSERCSLSGGMIGMTTAKGRTAYLHVFRWPGREITIASVKNRALSAKLLATGEEVEVSQEGDRVFVKNLQTKPPDPYDTVMAVKLDGKPEALPSFRHIP